MTKLARVIDVDNVTKVIHRRCEDFRVGLQWEDPTHSVGPRTDRGTIYLPALGHPITQEMLDKIYGFVIHECGHHIRPEVFDIAEKSQPPDHLLAILNTVEDTAMERDLASRWRGDRKALSGMNHILLKEVSHTYEHNQQQYPTEWEEQDPRPMAVLALGQLASLDWDSERSAWVRAVIDRMPDEARKLTDELAKEGWVDKIQQCQSVWDSWNTSVDLAKRLYPENNEEEYEQVRESGNPSEASGSNEGGQEGGGSSSGDTEEPSSGQGDRGNAGSAGQTPRGDGAGGSRDPSNDTFPDKAQGKQQGDGRAADGSDGEGDEGDSDDDSNGDGSATSTKQLIDWKDIVLSDHDWQSDGHEGGGAGIDWSDYTGGYAFSPEPELNVVDLEKYNSSGNPWFSHRDRNWKKFMPDNSGSRAFGNQIRRYIQSIARSRTTRHQYQGKLDKSSMVKLALPPIDGGEYNKKIFYDMKKARINDTAIFVLCDWSGSMRGDKMEHAADAAHRLVHTMERVLKIPVAMALFSNRHSNCDVGYVKKWNTRGLTEEAISRRLAKFVDFTSANNDACAVHWAYTQLKKRKESRKILIVLSDGAPTGAYMGGNPSGSLSWICDYIHKDRDVELWGVGICSRAVEKYYKNVKVLTDTHEINQTLFNIVKSGYEDYQKRRK